jgi:epsilon-lactone hydrolase
LAGTTEAVLLADASKMRVLSVDYRMPPDNPFPAAPDDVLTVWKAVLKDYAPKNVVMRGTSAGGGSVRPAPTCRRLETATSSTPKWTTC